MLDIFPFPIIQDTEMRTDITGEFAEHLLEYFVPFVWSVLNCLNVDLKETRIYWGITATKYAGTQLMFGENSRSCFENNFQEFFNNPITHPCTNNIYHKNIIRFYRRGQEQAAEDNYLNIPNWTTSNGENVLSPYFIFVVSLLFANRWTLWRQERKDQNKRYSLKAFVKFLYSDEDADGRVTLVQINELLAQKPVLPIFSTDKGGISLVQGKFFNSM